MLQAWIRPQAMVDRGERFRRDEGGAAIILGLLLFIAMVLVSGIAVDMMRYESERQRLQGTADRATIAATMLRENPGGVEPEDIVRSYFEAEGLGHVLPEDGIYISAPSEGSRTVTITPRARMQTSFMNWNNVAHLDLALTSQAIEGLGMRPIEIVLVLDVSGSMNFFQRMENLREAAIEFVTEMLEDNTDGRVAITIVPYSTEVIMPTGTLNLFPNLDPPLSGNMTNAFCLDFWTWNSVTDSFNAPMFRRNCDLRSNTAFRIQNMPVRPYFHDAAEAVAYIETLGPTWGTSIDLGVRVGAMFLDPSIRPVISHLIDQGQVSSMFEGRPFDWNPTNDSREPIRALVLMTDGENCCFHPGHAATRKPSLEIQDADTIAVCSALRAQGVTIYGVAFEAPPGGEVLMAACASSAGHYFNSLGRGVINAFRQIATHVQTQALRLTQ